MTNLQSRLQQIANDFVASTLSAMRSASLADLAGQGNGSAVVVARRAGRPPSAARPAAAVAAIAAASPAPRAAARRGGGRRKRATPEEVQKQKDTAFAVAKTLKPGFSKGEVMKKSGSKVDLGRALGLLVDERKLVRKGDRRLARYWVK